MNISADHNRTAKPDKYFKLALGALILLYALVVGRAAVIKLAALGMGFDLGMYEQVIWNTAHGNLFATSAFSYTTNHLGSDPILLELLLAPIYALAPVTETLLVLQAIAIALGALPLYLLARDRLGSRWAALAIAAAYLAYVPLVHLALDEFQPRAFALVCVLFAVYYLDRERYKPFVLFLALSLTTRSDVALWVALMGIVALLWRRPWRFVVTPIVLGVGWFVLALFVIVPHFKTTSGGFVYLSTYAWLGKTPGEMVVTAVTRPLYVLQNLLQPGKVLFLAEVFGPLAPFTLLRPDLLLLAGPTLAINLLSPYSIQWTITHQYGAMLYPIAFASAVMGLGWLTRRKWLADRVSRRWLVLAGSLLILGLTLAENVALGNPALKLWLSQPDDRRLTAEALVAGISPEAPLAVTNHVGPLAARRSGFYFFPPHTFYTSNPLQVADYVLIDMKYDGDTPTLKPALQTLQTSSDWKLLANRDGYLMYGKVSHLP